jgi:uncharacterized membrane-anchored protein YjiN (DUF445 family)
MQLPVLSPRTTDRRSADEGISASAGASNRMEGLARGSLLLALAIAVAGKLLASHTPFWGGLLFAFGEAALVGGLADWFAVRALFTHPFGIPFPHTAIIPRNRQRIVQEIRGLVEKEWLPRSLLVGKVEAFDFVGSGLLPMAESLRPRLQEVIRSVGRDVLAGVAPRPLAAFLARGVAGSIDPDKVGPILADLTARARDQGWLEPLLREWVGKLQQWSERPESRTTIRRQLEQAANAYREKGWFKNVTFKLAEKLGGIDLDDAALVLLVEVRRFAAEQMAEGGAVQEIVRDGLAGIESRLRSDPDFLHDVREFVLETSETGSLSVLLEPVIASLRSEGMRELDSEDSRIVGLAMDQLDSWLKRLSADEMLREQVNAWCRRIATGQVEQHHTLIGALVEEQLNRLSERNLSELIEDKVGEDLNWIRLNGALVGGLIGMALYLLFGLFPGSVR